MVTKVARLDIRTTAAVKAMIEEAARYLGISVAAFITEPVVKKARAVLREAQVIELSDQESDRFLAALDNPPKPNARLRRLFKEHKNKKTKGK